jgi:hypothetical protein
MNRPPILLLGFTGYTDKGLAVKTNFIIDSMTGNLLYQDAGTKLTNVETAIELFAIAMAKKGKVLNYASVKAGARKELVTVLKTLGEYVRDKYPGNVGNWLTSGYNVQTFDGTTQVPDIPLIKKAVDGPLTGETVIITDRPKYTYVFEGRHWEEGQTAPASVTAVSKTKRVLFEALVPGKTYLFQIRTRGTKGISKWSNPMVFIVR